MPALLQEAANAFILPRFRRLLDSQVEEKSPGELVTVADREVEAFLSERLSRLAPGSIVIGEEACTGAPGLLDELRSRRCWVLDPLDGTGNFVAGRPEFAILLAYLEEGRCMASWLYRPVDETLAFAARGAGAFVGGRRVRVAPSAGHGLHGIVKTRFLPPGTRERVVERAASRLSVVLPGANCTAFDYPDIVSAEADFALYWRTLAWDHAPGALLLEEAGGVVKRLDGSPYHPADPREGLLAARDEATWACARSALFD